MNVPLCIVIPILICFLLEDEIGHSRHLHVVALLERVGLLENESGI